MVFNRVQFGEGTVDSTWRIHDFVNVFGCYSVCHQSHLNQGIAPGVDATFPWEFLYIEEVRNGAWLGARKSPFLIKRHVGPPDLWNDTVIGQRDV